MHQSISAMTKDTYPMSLRLPPELHQRLEECAARLKIKRHTLAQNAIEAAIEAIERNGYRLSLPLQFRFPNESEAEMARYPQEQEVITSPSHFAALRGPANIPPIKER